MHVDHLLRLDRLGLSLVWGDPALLGQEISGVTATDLEDPGRFLQPGEVVLSGLVWWSPGGDGRARADRFVSALREAGAVALLAGEETHGEVPGDLAAACREHRVPLLAVPARTSFRAVTEAVYLRRWADLSRRPDDHYALPENVRAELGRAVERGAPPGELLDRAFAHLGTPACHLLTGSGRTVARTATAGALTAARAVELLRGATGTTLRVEADDTPYDAWHLHLADEGQAPPRVVQEIAEVLGRSRRRPEHRRAARDAAGARLADAVGAAVVDSGSVREALGACGLADRASRTVVVATLSGPDGGEPAAAALREALHHLPSVAFAVADRPGGEALAVVAHDEDGGPSVRDGLRAVWPALASVRQEALPHAGVSEPVGSPGGLGAAVAQARYALAAARTASPEEGRVSGVGELTGLELLLAGMPRAVRSAFRETVLGPLLHEGRASNAVLLDTLEVFLAHNCSWARTAEALHLHVNTVHYRIQRVESLTGRELSRLDHKTDLRAALLCR
ncbi:PucR family transcriptional regulator [Streptomyces sp. NPDC015131]|uniref:PucR family transcriptional regulator n=1 Tax=Streptomyces sp. NPDC015131 TaxID=3364941 RepID=UPI0036FD30BE